MASDVQLDPAQAYPEIAALRTALAAGEWATCRAILDPAGPAARTLLLRDAAEMPNLDEDFLRDVLRADPDDSTAAALLGSHLTAVGWSVRTRASAAFVSREQFTAFRDWLCRAERVLVDAAALHPHDPAVWTARMPTARGLQLGLAESRRRYHRLAGADPHHLPGQRHLLQQLCPKWDGTWEQAHAFAREAAAASPPGSHNAVLIAEAHIEHWFDASDNYLTYPAVLGELYDAGRHSVWHPEFHRTIGWVEVMSTFAMAFSLGGDRRAAATLFAALGPLAAPWPWSYLGDPEEAIRTHRDGTAA